MAKKGKTQAQILEMLDLERLQVAQELLEAQAVTTDLGEWIDLATSVEEMTEEFRFVKQERERLERSFRREGAVHKMLMANDEKYRILAEKVARFSKQYKNRDHDDPTFGSELHLKYRNCDDARQHYLEMYMVAINASVQRELDELKEAYPETWARIDESNEQFNSKEEQNAE